MEYSWIDFASIRNCCPAEVVSNDLDIANLWSLKILGKIIRQTFVLKIVKLNPQFSLPIQNTQFCQTLIFLQ